MAGGAARSKKPAAGGRRKARKPVGWWSVFNDWWRAEHDHLGRRPITCELVAWYTGNAHTVWEDASERPTWKETRIHAKCLRSCQDVKMYFRKYRAQKQDGHDASHRRDSGDDTTDEEDGEGDDDGEDPGASPTPPSRGPKAMPAQQQPPQRRAAAAYSSPLGRAPVTTGQLHEAWNPSMEELELDDPDSASLGLTASYGAPQQAAAAPPAAAARPRGGAYPSDPYRSDGGGVFSPFARMAAASAAAPLPAFQLHSRFVLPKLVLPGAGGASLTRSGSDAAASTEGGGSNRDANSLRRSGGASAGAGAGTTTHTLGSDVAMSDAMQVQSPPPQQAAAAPHRYRCAPQQHAPQQQQQQSGLSRSATAATAATATQLPCFELLHPDDRWEVEPLSPATLDALSNLLDTSGAEQGALNVPEQRFQPSPRCWLGHASAGGGGGWGFGAAPSQQQQVPSPLPLAVTRRVQSAAAADRPWDELAGQGWDLAPAQLGWGTDAGGGGGSMAELVFGETKQQQHALVWPSNAPLCETPLFAAAGPFGGGSRPPTARRSDPGPSPGTAAEQAWDDGGSAAYGSAHTQLQQQQQQLEAYGGVLAHAWRDPQSTYAAAAVVAPPQATRRATAPASCSTAQAVEAAAYMQQRCAEYRLEELADTCGLSSRPAARLPPPPAPPAPLQPSRLSDTGGGRAAAPPPSARCAVEQRPTKRLACELPPLPPAPLCYQDSLVGLAAEGGATSPHRSGGSGGSLWARTLGAAPGGLRRPLSGRSASRPRSGSQELLLPPRPTSGSRRSTWENPRATAVSPHADSDSGGGGRGGGGGFQPFAVERSAYSASGVLQFSGMHPLAAVRSGSTGSGMLGAAFSYDSSFADEFGSPRFGSGSSPMYH